MKQTSFGKRTAPRAPVPSVLIGDNPAGGLDIASKDAPRRGGYLRVYLLATLALSLLVPALVTVLLNAGWRGGLPGSASGYERTVQALGFCVPSRTSAPGPCSPEQAPK
jgi:hypothetical protein